VKILLTSILFLLALNVSSQRISPLPARKSHIVDSLKNIPFKMVIAPDFYAKNLSFFCRQELKFEKATTVKFRFRLGSVEQTDFLEGKRKPAIAASQKLPAH
jgi:hypothetical protein